MKTRTQIIAIAALFVVAAGMPAKVGAQPENQHYLFYSDEGGGSYLGVDTRDITSDRLGDLHVKDESGVEVTMVDQDAPAGKAGLKEHDVILRINDQKIESVEQLRRVVHEVPPGRTVTIGISRAGQPMSLKTQLAERDMDRNINVTVPPINIPAIHIPPIPPINMPEIDVPTVVVIHSPRSSGMMVENLTPQLGDYFGVKSGNGVLIRSVERGSRAEQGGFRAGDVIVKVNGSVVSDCSDFTRLLRERKENKAVVTVVRDRKEQNLTLTLPEPRRTGSLKHCDYVEAATCAQFINEGTKVAAQAIPELATAEFKRLQPQMERLQKQMREEMQAHQGEVDDVKKDLEQLQQELKERQEELQLEIKHWVKESDI